MAAVERRPSVVYVVPDKMGGMMNIIANLLAHRQRDGLDHDVVLTHNTLDRDTRYGMPLAADHQTTVEYTLPTENLHAVIRRLSRAVSDGGGVYVAGDLLDLATASVHDFGRAVIHILHGDTEYYYDLAVKHDAVVHAFVAYSRRMFDELCTRLPHRRDTIFHLPYGIAMPPVGPDRRSPPVLRAIFAGRLENGQKGIFDLPRIDRALRDRDVAVAWTVAGAGPDEAALRERWAFNPDVNWCGRLSTAQLMGEYERQDLFVLPTRNEGFPVALVEAMAAGLVPVVSDIASGVPEVVTAHTGVRAPVGDISAFAEAIGALAADRGRLAAIGRAARDDVRRRFDIRDRVGAYHDLYARWRELYRPVADARHLRYGSRLDRKWIPNTVVRLVRSTRSAPGM